MNRLIEYFDLYSTRRPRGSQAQATGSDAAPPNIWIALHFLALFLGIIAETFIESLGAQGGAAFLSVTRLVVALIVAASVFPAVFKKSIAEAGPNVLQLCVTFAAGMGYKSLIDIEV